MPSQGEEPVPMRQGLWPIQGRGQLLGKRKHSRAARAWEEARLKEWAGDSYTAFPIHSVLHILKLIHGQ